MPRLGPQLAGAYYSLSLLRISPSPSALPLPLLVPMWLLTFLGLVITLLTLTHRVHHEPYRSRRFFPGEREHCWNMEHDIKRSGYICLLLVHFVCMEDVDVA